MASIEKRGKSWCVRYVVKDAYGNIIGQKRKSGFATKADAMEAAKSLEQATARGVDVHGDQLTCGELMERWFLTKEGEVERTTLSNYSADIDALRDHAIYGTKVAQLNSGSLKQLINDLIADRGICVRSATDYTRPLRYALKWAAKTGLILRDPFIGAKLPRAAGGKKVIISEQDIDDLVRMCKKKTPAFLTPLYLALYGGLCREEVAGLTWSNVLPNGVRIQSAVTSTCKGGKVVKAPKTVNRTRTVTLPRFVMDHLRTREHVSEYVCVSRTGAPYSLCAYTHTVGKLVARINRERKQAGKEPMPKPSYHDLRHTHAAMCIALGIQPKVIQERLGHASISITMDLYGYLMPGLQEQVADALDSKWSSGQVSGQAQSSAKQENVEK